MRGRGAWICVLAICVISCGVHSAPRQVGDFLDAVTYEFANVTVVSDGSSTPVLSVGLHFNSPLHLTDETQGWSGLSRFLCRSARGVSIINTHVPTHDHQPFAVPYTRPSLPKSVFFAVRMTPTQTPSFLSQCQWEMVSHMRRTHANLASLHIAGAVDEPLFGGVVLLKHATLAVTSTAPTAQEIHALRMAAQCGGGERSPLALCRANNVGAHTHTHTGNNTYSAPTTLLQADDSVLAGVGAQFVGGFVKPVFKPMGDLFGEIAGGSLVSALLAPICYAIASVLSSELGGKLEPALAAPTIDRILPALTENVVDELVLSMSSSMAQYLTEKLGESLTEAVTAEVGAKVSVDTVAEVSVQAGSAIGTKLVDRIAKPVVSSVAHTVAASLVETIPRSPMHNYFCFYCATKNVYCAYCPAPDNQRRYYALYYTGYYSQFYTQYYRDFYVAHPGIKLVRKKPHDVALDEEAEQAKTNLPSE